MARPTNKHRVIRLLREMGESPDGTVLLVQVRRVLGPGADSAILDLIEEQRVQLSGSNTRLRLIEG